MRKIFTLLIVLGLLAALSAPASAADIKVSGQYYAQGVYESNHSLRDEAGRNLLTGSGKASSTAFVGQRLRLQPEFKIAEGLTLTTRFDALEKKWGDVSWGQNGVYAYDNTNRSVDRPAGHSPYGTLTGNDATGGIRTQENNEWERAYVDFNTAIGRFLVGYMNTIYFGTDFLNSAWSRPGVEYSYPMGPWTFGARWEHVAEGGSYGIAGNARLLYADADLDIYSLMTDYRWKTGAVGLQFQFYNDNFNDYDRGGFIRDIYTFNPYVKATFGSLFIEAEGWYGIGDWADYRDARQDVDLKAWAAYANAKYTMGPWYVGLLGSYITGDADPTDDEQEGSVMQTLWLGKNYDVFLLMFNNTINSWVGNWGTYGTTINTFEDNSRLFKAYIGWNMTPKLRVEAGYGMAWADETAAGVNDEYGSEFDIYATYKIYSNLSYMVGLGYWWVGDYFKGTTTSAIDDDYLLTHRLTLSF